MRAMIIGLVTVGLVAAVSATVFAVTLRADSADRGAPDEQEDEREVVVIVAAEDLPAMTVIDGDLIATTIVLESEVPEGALTSTVQIVGQIITTPVVEGQLLLRSLLASEGAGMHLAVTLPEGGRAMSILLTDESGIEDLLYPGCLVDVMASFRVPGMRGGVSGEIISATLIQSARVLGVGGHSVVANNASIEEATDKLEGDRRIVTLLVDTRQAEVLPQAFAITDSHYGRTAEIQRCVDCGFLQCGGLGDVVGMYEALEDQEYEDTRKERALQMKRLLDRVARDKPAGRLLDVGAGSGILVEEAIARGYEASGVEPSEWLQQQACRHGLPVHLGTLPLPELEGPYEVVTLVDVLEHVTDPIALLEQSRRVLAPDGLLAIVTAIDPVGPSPATAPTPAPSAIVRTTWSVPLPSASRPIARNRVHENSSPIVKSSSATPISETASTSSPL